MGQIKTITLPISIILALVVFPIYCQARSHHRKKACANVDCQDPPSNFKCTEFSESNSKADVPKPSGENAECCPLWHCHEKSKKSGPWEFYTFHGMLGDPGGTEIVKYKSTRSGIGLPIFNMVTSMATGNHDSIAIAGDTKAGEDFMRDALKSLSF